MTRPALYTQDPAFYTSHSKLCTTHSSPFTPHALTLHAPQSTLCTSHFPFQTPYSQYPARAGGEVSKIGRAYWKQFASRNSWCVEKKRFEMTWNAWNEGIEMNKLKSMNWNEWLESNDLNTSELTWMSCNKWSDMNDLKRNEWVEINELRQMTSSSKSAPSPSIFDMFKWKSSSR